MQEFKEIVNALFATRNGEFNNKFEALKIQNFKELCKKKKLIFLGLGYYGKKMEKYLKLKYNVEVYGYYDWLEEVKNAKGPFAKYNDLTYGIIDEKKYYKKPKDSYNLISFDEFYKNPDDFVIFINAPGSSFNERILNDYGFRHYYELRSLAKDIINTNFINKTSRNYLEYDFDELNHQYSQAQIAKIITLYDNLKDEKSKEVFKARLKFKLTEDFHYILEVNNDENLQYLDPEVINFKDDEVFVDCGGYIGDTIEAFYKRVNGNFEHIYSFEPEINNFEKLRENIKKLKNNKNISPINAGVSHENKVFYIKGHGENSRITSEITDRKIKISNIATSVEKIPTFIKMDIEGFEINALLGAKDIIQKHKPKLAICIYHKFSDLWEIPLLLKLWVPEYELIMRHYSPTWEETVIYAIPKTI